jgi:hypothetical protein
MHLMPPLVFPLSPPLLTLLLLLLLSMAAAKEALLEKVPKLGVSCCRKGEDDEEREGAHDSWFDVMCAMRGG